MPHLFSKDRIIAPPGFNRLQVLLALVEIVDPKHHWVEAAK